MSPAPPARASTEPGAPPERVGAFSFRTAAELVFGAGESDKAPARAARLGKRVLLVTGRRSIEETGTLAVMLDGLARAGAEAERWIVAEEPDTALVDAGARRAREGQFDVVLAVGGGSAIDAAKAVAALATNDGAALDYIEEVGGGRPIERPSLPVIAVPTTAGSGSEVTRNSVVRIPELAVKRSIRGDALLPRLAIIDPLLSARAPVHVAASSGLDALTHLIEAYLSKGAQPMTDALIAPGIRMALRGLGRLAALAGASATGAATNDPGGAEAMAVASVWGGIALANAGLGAVHGLVAPLGGRCKVAHGDACGCLLPATLEVNLRALRDRAPRSRALSRFGEIASLVVPDGEPTPERAVAELASLRRRLGVKPLSGFGVTPADIPAIIAGSRAGSMRYNPVDLSDAELHEILERSLST